MARLENMKKFLNWFSFLSKQKFNQAIVVDSVSFEDFSYHFSLLMLNSTVLSNKTKVISICAN